MGGIRPNRSGIAAAATRLEILSAAPRVVAERGCAATTINQIAAEA